ncbi:MAG: hypothetical protein QG619_1567 [Pseudomonadota bacterium]|nr:hypothetical protein [Pseudomonadota bacterium]
MAGILRLRKRFAAKTAVNEAAIFRKATERLGLRYIAAHRTVAV